MIKTKPNIINWLYAIGRAFSAHFRAIMVFGLAINLLLLVSPLYMLQVYDRVLSSGSFDPLLWLTLIAVVLLIIYGAAEAGRRRISLLLATAIEDHFAPRIFAKFENTLDNDPHLLGDIQRLARLTMVFQNGSVLAFFDLPFAPLFFLCLFILHPILGMIGLAGALIVFVMAARAENAARDISKSGSASQSAAFEFAAGLVRQRSAMIAMGIVTKAYDRWLELRQRATALTMMAGDKEGQHAGASRAARQILQIVVLAAGAALALSQTVSPGAIVAASILVARALAPIDQITGAWRQLVQAREAWIELDARLGEVALAQRYTPLPRPEPSMLIDRLAVTIPGQAEPIIRPFNHYITAGQKIAIMGANGCGKSALLQTLAGVWSPGAGLVSLGQRDLHAWPGPDRGPFVGYVPQDIELIAATVADNISRLSDFGTHEIIDAAKRCGAHDAILTLPLGYDTVIGPGGVNLSRGQTQLVGLARAFFRSPVLLLLDEPTANLDQTTAMAAQAAINGFSADGGIVIVATHDQRLVADFDQILRIQRGNIEAFPVAEFLAAPAHRLHIKSKISEASA